MRDLAIDVQRVLLLFLIIFKYGTGPIVRHILKLAPRGTSNAVYLRLALQELGLTYLKLGQFLATRFDILPVEVCRELNMLFEDIPPMTFEVAKAVIESELKGPLHEFFPVFNREPIAAASVAQVHEARTLANERVAVKVQRPGIERLFMSDMRNLRRFAKFIDAFRLFSDLVGGFSAKEVADEFSTWTLREMNFILEGRTADRFRKNALPYEIVPKIYWDYTTPKVLTMEFVDGISLARIGNLLEAGRSDIIIAQLPNLDIKRTGRHITFAVMRQLFVTGLFHGDLHPGNILIRDDNKVVFVDFGIFGQLTDEQREVLMGHIENIALGNIDESFRQFAKQFAPTDETDLRAFEEEGKSILRQWYQTALSPYSSAKERHFGIQAIKMMDVIRRHRLRASTDIMLFWRALYYLDASALRLSEYFDMMKQMRDFFEENRPDVVERVLKIGMDQSQTIAFFELTRGLIECCADILNSLSRRNMQWPRHLKDSPSSQRARNMETRRLAMAVMGVTLIAISVAAHYNSPVRLVIITLVVLLVMMFVSALRRI